VENEGSSFRHNLLPTSTMETDRFSIESNNNETAADINKAHLVIGNLEREVDVTTTMNSAAFLVHLKPGETSLKAWFSGDKKYNANYLNIRRIGPPVREGISNYKPVHPDKLLRP
jgi:hypothetical protein